MDINNMKTATNEKEFEQLVKEGKPFQLKAAHHITIAKLPGEQPPIVQISGNIDVILQMLIFGISEVAENMRKNGVPKEEIKALFHGGVEMAVELTDLPDNDPAPAADQKGE